MRADIGTLASHGTYPLVPVAGSNYTGLRNKRYAVDTSAGPLAMNLRYFGKEDKFIILDSAKNFGTAPLTLKSTQGIFHQSGTDTLVLDQNGEAGEWVFRFDNGVFYTETSPTITPSAIPDSHVSTITTTPSTPVAIAHGMGTDTPVVMAWNVVTQQAEEVLYTVVDTNSISVDSNVVATYRIVILRPQ